MSSAPQTIKAALCPQYGPPSVIKIGEVPSPSITHPSQILISVKTSSVSAGDNRVRGAIFPPGMVLLGKMALGFSGPRQPILGTELAGIVEEVGEKVTMLKKGDHVVAFPGSRMGAHAEKVVLKETDAVVKIPDDFDLKLAGCLSFGAMTALHFLKESKLSPGEKILIIGGSGSVGSAAIQFAAHHFKLHVTAVTSTKNLDLVRQLGANEVIDYTTTDFRNEKKKYDVIMEVVGTLGYYDCWECLEEKGRFLMVAGRTFGEILGGNLRPQRGPHRIVAPISSEARELFEEVVAMAMEGKYTPVIDQVIPFERIVEAHEVAFGGHKKGNVVVTFP